MDTKTLVAVTYDRKYNSPKILKVANFNNDYFKEDDLFDFINDLNEECNIGLSETDINQLFVDLTMYESTNFKTENQIIVISQYIQEM